MLGDEAFRTDPAVTERELDALRDDIEDAPMPAWMMTALDEVQRSFPEGTPIRCRSSTNNEDLEGFNGARNENVLVRAGQTTSLNVTLTLGAVEEELIVTAENPIVDVTSAATGQDITLELVGARDPDNPACVPEATLRAWDASGAVRWHGAVDDVRAVWARASIAVLPSYREGLPMSLLEAAACGRPIVTTDVPGCREVVVDGETGLLVPARDPRALADAIARLAADAVLRRRLGAAARRRVEARFAREIVVGQTLDLYARLLAGRGT